jgi:exosome complex RNA-binding protein Rrp42 (RNase PH superfamily)
MKQIPISITLGKFDDKYLVDLTNQEYDSMACILICVLLNEEEFCLVEQVITVMSSVIE